MTGSIGSRIMCASGAKCLSVDCCFSELELCKYNKVYWSRTKRISSSHWKLICSRYDIVTNIFFGVKQQSLTHSLTSQSLLFLQCFVDLCAFYLYYVCVRLPLVSFLSLWKTTNEWNTKKNKIKTKQSKKKNKQILFAI